MDKIKAICFSKSNILVVVATCFAFLRDTKDLIINFNILSCFVYFALCI